MELDNFEHAEIDLATGNYRTHAQFIEVSECAFHGVFSDATKLFKKYGFCVASYIDHIDEYCDDLINDNVKIEMLKDLAYIVYGMKE